MKKSVIIVIVIVMLFSMTTVSFADVSGISGEDEDFKEELVENTLLPPDTIIDNQPNEAIEPYSSSSITITGSFKRKSGKGRAVVSGMRVNSTKMTSIITLQEYSKTAKKYINSSAKSATKSASGFVISQSATFTVSSSKTYRIKITMKAKEGTVTYSKVSYRNLIAG